MHQSWMFVKLVSANSAILSEVPKTPKRFRPKEKVPKPKISDQPQPEWPKEFKDLVL